MEVSAMLQQATDSLDAGNAIESAALCGAVLAREPQNPVAAHLLGLAVIESGDWSEGEQWLRHSIRLQPTCAEFYSNLANLLRRQEKFHKAERNYRRSLELAPKSRPTRRSLALTLIDLGRFDEAEVESRSLLEDDPSDADAWVLIAMTLASSERLEDAEAAYRRAIELDPNNHVAHHNLGALLSRLDHPEAALEALGKAASLGTDGYELAFNQARALLDLNDLDAAEAAFDRAVAFAPSNLEGQAHLARIRFMRGDPKFARALATASAADRGNFGLQTLLGQLLWRAGSLVAAETVLYDVLARSGPNPSAQSVLAGILLDAGMLKEAEMHALEAATAVPDNSDIVETLVTILLTRDRAEDALPFIDALRRRYPQSQAWIAYEASASRQLGTDAHHRLYDYDRFVRCFEVGSPAGWTSMRELNGALTQVLADRHRFEHHPLEQTLRNGTQTARGLLADPDAAIQSILRAFAGPIAEYRNQVGTDLDHPMTARNRGESKFTGAWSVRLRRQGFHVNHIHPDGWLSSAYYVDVPAEVADTRTKSGWLKFGEPRYPVPRLPPDRFIQPRAGRLVLFPSYMWHGTNPIVGNDSRLTIAFDVKPG